MRHLYIETALRSHDEFSQYRLDVDYTALIPCDRFSIDMKMSSYQYRKFHFGNMMVIPPLWNSLFNSTFILNYFPRLCYEVCSCYAFKSEGNNNQRLSDVFNWYRGKYCFSVKPCGLDDPLYPCFPNFYLHQYWTLWYRKQYLVLVRRSMRHRIGSWGKESCPDRA